MFKTDREQSILNSQKRKEMLSLYRSALLYLSKMKLIGLQVDITASFRDTFDFHITVFDDHNGLNETFYAYSFQDVSAIKDDLIIVLKAIKSDRFSEFSTTLKEISNKNYPTMKVLS